MKNISLFDVTREELFELISSKLKYFTHLQDKQKKIWIFNCEELDPIKLSW